MNLVYDKDNKERVPFEHYLEEYKTKDPLEISARTGFPIFRRRSLFRYSFFGKEYRISFPEYEIRCPGGGLFAAAFPDGCQDSGDPFPDRGMPGSLPPENFSPIREVPWGEVYFRQFQGRCMMRLAYGYGSRLERIFRKNGEKLGAGPVGACGRQRVSV